MKKYRKIIDGLMSTTKRSITQGLPKDYDDHGCRKKRKKKMAARENSKIVSMSPNTSPLDSVEIASKVFPFLEAQDLLNFVSCRQDYCWREYLTYPLVLRSILLTGGGPKDLILLHWPCLRNIYGSTYDAPDPLGILKFACISFGKTFQETFRNSNRQGIVYATGEISPDYNDQNFGAIRAAIDETHKRIERRMREKTDSILVQLANLLGEDHPCGNDILKGRRWDVCGYYQFKNKFVDTTLKCVLGLGVGNHPGSVTEEQILEAYCVLSEYYGEHQRQGRILTCLNALIFRGGESWRRDQELKWVHLSTIAIWEHLEKRFVFVQEAADGILKEFLIQNRDKDPAIVAKQILEMIQESPIYSVQPPSRSPLRFQAQISEENLRRNPPIWSFMN